MREPNRMAKTLSIIEGATTGDPAKIRVVFEIDGERTQDVFSQ